MRILRLILAVICMALLSSASCKKPKTGGPIYPPPPSSFVKGADVSWITQMENEGRKFYNASGTQQDPIQILKDLGMNSIRLRAWVNPSNGWNSTADLLSKAIRAKNLGMRIMIDFHYSDTWADPGQQAKPAAWATQDAATLAQSVYAYTRTVLAGLKANSVTPEWVQVGNETNDGMLWPEGKASTNMASFAAMIKAGYDAVKAEFSTAKVIVHLSNGFDNNLYRWLFDGLKANGANWDIIGMSLYPSVSNWAYTNDQCLANMINLVQRYNTPIMICEVGMPWDSPSACQSFLTDLISKTRSVPNSNGLGVFFWEPECSAAWNGYTLGAFDNSGKPTSALNAFN